jgi:hypothetical protein
MGGSAAVRQSWDETPAFSEILTGSSGFALRVGWNAARLLACWAEQP